MEAAYLADHYRELDDDALLRIAADRRDLTPEAAMVLDAELSSRCLRQTQIDDLAQQDRAVEAREVRARARANRRIVFRGGFGFEYYGRSNMQRRMGTEIYAATLFFIVLWFPIIPVGTYRVIRSRSAWWSGSSPKVVEKLPLDWNQVLHVWTKALLIVLAIALAFRYIR
jgi:hypothetical protein